MGSKVAGGGMHFCRKLRRVPRPVALPVRIIGGHRLPEAANAVARQSVRKERYRLCETIAAFGAEVGLDEQGPGCSIKCDPERAIVGSGPIDGRAHIVELVLVA